MLKATTFLSLFLFSTQLMAQSVSVEKLVELSKSACLAGERLDVKISGDGGITLFKKSLGGVEGGVSLHRQEIQGAVGLASEAAVLEENKAIRLCILQMIALLRSAESLPPPTKNQDKFLPSNQWLGVNSPLPVIDSKVRVIISSIRHVSRIRRVGEMSDVSAVIKVEVPRRPRVGREISKGQSMKFIYYDETYVLTLLEVSLQDQRVKFTITEE